jgi:cobalt-zinc-cadmium efflux system protein
MHTHDHANEKNFKTAFYLNLGFAVAEFAGGIFTNSLAILADALHDFGDSLSILFSWQMERFSHKTGDGRYSYGYKRFSLLSALITAAILLTGSFFVISESFDRIAHPQHSNAQGMFILALVGIAINGYAALRTRKGRSMSSRIISLHLFEDVLGWTSVLIVSIILLFKDIHYLDPVLSIGVSAFVIFNVVKNIKETVVLFLQGVPKSVDISWFEKEISSLEKVKGLHHTHVWSLDGEQHVLTTHVILESDAKKEQIRVIKNRIKTLCGSFGVTHSTVEFEYLDDDCSMCGEKELERK